MLLTHESEALVSSVSVGCRTSLSKYAKKRKFGVSWMSLDDCEKNATFIPLMLPLKISTKYNNYVHQQLDTSIIVPSLIASWNMKRGQ